MSGAAALVLGLSIALFLIVDEVDDLRAASLSDRARTNVTATPLPQGVKTDAFLPFQCQTSMEVCAQAIATKYCREQEAGTPLSWHAEPVVSSNTPPNTFALKQITCGR